MYLNKNIGNIVVLIASLLSITAVGHMAFAQSSQVVAGIDYLQTVQDEDGSWGQTETSLNKIFPNTSAALTTLKTLEATPADSQTRAIAFLAAQSVDVTSYLAARMIALAGTSYDTSTDLDTLLLRQNDDGGWGTGPGFGSNVLDTAMALLALDATGVDDYGVLSRGLNYLVRYQKTDGGWGLPYSDESQIFCSALCLQAVNAFRLQFSMALCRNHAIDYLRGTQNADGGYGAPFSTAFETAHVLLGILDAGQPLTTAEDDALDHLINSQDADGSWNDDAYSTALAVLALGFPLDTDGDGMPDEFETANGLDPNDPLDADSDLDNDGLSNLQELYYGTNPGSPDTDGDGVNDQDELASGSDPLDPGSQNLPPVIDSQPVLIASEGVLYNYQVQADDPDGDSLWFDLLRAPDGMSISGDGLVSWTPAADQAGTATVIIEVSDGRGGSVPQQYRLMVLAEGIDLAVGGVDTSGMATDSQTLVTLGICLVDVANMGGSLFEGSFQVLVFEDSNGNDTFDAGVDMVLGSSEFSGSIDSGTQGSLDVPVSGVVQFSDNLVYAFVDFTEQIPELDETNNTGNSGQGSLYHPPVGEFQPTVEWYWDNPNDISSGLRHTPVVAPLIDTNGDGLINERDVPAVIALDYGYDSYDSGNLVALRGDTGEVIFSVPNPSSWWNQFGAPAVGDIDADGRPEIIAYGYMTLYAFNNDGTIKWESPDRINWAFGQPSLADVDGDGQSEIIHTTDILNNDGTVRTRITADNGWNEEQMAGSRLVVDLDMDGIPEIVSGPCVYDLDGNVVWRWRSWPNSADGSYIINGELNGGATTITLGDDEEEGKYWTGLGASWTAAANVDEDPYPEIIAVTNLGNHDSMWIFDHDGQIHAGPFDLFENVFNETGYIIGPPAVADFDGDGQPEIAMGVSKQLSQPLMTFDDHNRYIFTIYEVDGTILWQKNLTNDYHYWANPATAFDFDGDGAAEVVFSDTQKLFILDGSNGDTLFEMAVERILDAQNNVYSTIADVDNDGDAEIIVPCRRRFTTGAPPRNGVLVLGDSNGNWLNARRIWNQHRYHVTNIDEDAGVPQVERNSWQVNNTHMAQAPIEGLDPFAAPDLSVSRITINDQNCPAEAGITARIGNGGSLHAPAGIPVNFYLGDPDAGGTLIANASTNGALYPGEFEDVTIQWDAPVAGQIFVTVNETPDAVATPSDNLSLLPNTWAETSGMTGTCGGSYIGVNAYAFNGIDDNGNTIWRNFYEDHCDLDPRDDFYEVHFPFPVNVESVTIENYVGATRGFLSGILTFSNGFSTPINLDANGEGTLSFEEQEDIQWIRLTETSTLADGVSLSEFIVGGSYVEPVFLTKEGEGRMGNNKAAYTAFMTPCDPDPEENQAPQIITAPPLTAVALDTYSYQVEAVDPDNDLPLAFSLTASPAGMLMDGDTGLVEWTPGETQLGGFSVAVQATDSRGAVAEQSFSINVTLPPGANQPPHIDSEPPTTASVDQVYQYEVIAGDPDGDTLLYSFLAAPSGADIGLFNGAISWTPTASQVGTRYFTLEVQDGSDGWATQSFAVEVEAATADLPPQPVDADGDGFDETEDCNDGDPWINPGATEVPDNGVDDDCNEATPELLPADSVECSITTDKGSYSSNTMAEFTISFQNLDAVLNIVGLQGQLTVSDSAGQEVFDTTVPVIDLAPNCLYKTKVILDTGTLPPDTYVATLDTEFGLDVICTSQVSFTIISSTSAGNAMSGSITANPVEIEQGEETDFSYQVINIGNVDISDLTLEILLAGDEDGIVTRTLPAENGILLNRGESFSNSQFADSTGMEPGDYLVILRGGETGAAFETVDWAYLRINPSVGPAPIQDLTTRAKSGKVSLVWSPVTGAAGYNIYRSVIAGGPYDLIMEGHVTDYATYLDLGVTNGVTYYYVVTSVDANGNESLDSNEASAIPQARTR